MNVIIAFGNPLLDTTIHIDSDEILKKFNLKQDDHKELTKNEMELLQTTITGYKKDYTPGGCAQNTLRVFQWLLNKKASATFFGSVGKDANAKLLKDLLKEDGVSTRYIEYADYPTGTTVALVNGPYRSLVAYLGAAEVLPLERLLCETISIPNIFETTDLVYMEGFFLTKRTTVARYILDCCLKMQKSFAFNISAKYLCEEIPEDVVYFCKNCSILFGNKREYETLKKILQAPTVEDLARYLVESKNGKIVVITDGSKTVKVVHDDVVEENEVPAVNSDEIRDTTGAGDAFVGGFLAGIFAGKAPTECCKLGCYAATEIIKRTGCTLPDEPPPNF